jgi:hypothetical protein
MDAGSESPEFIVTFNLNSDFLIVLECKADVASKGDEAKIIEIRTVT